jgi:hypothetical protein
MDPSSNRWRDSRGRYSHPPHQSVGIALMWAAFHRIDDALLRLAWLPSVVLLAAFVLVIVQASDRKEPFQILSVEPAEARPGETVTIRAQVWRDQSRNCSAAMSRSVFDATNVRWDYPLTKFSDAMIDRMESNAPGELKVSIMVPQSASSGTAHLVSVLEYRCNRVHAIWPIEVTTTMPFTVLP